VVTNKFNWMLHGLIEAWTDDEINFAIDSLEIERRFRSAYPEEVPQLVADRAKLVEENLHEQRSIIS
jgi:hypothetical protein